MTPQDQFRKARDILLPLVQGLHPMTGDELPKEDVVNHIESTGR